jgi:hypothetical protein
MFFRPGLAALMLVLGLDLGVVPVVVRAQDSPGPYGPEGPEALAWRELLSLSGAKLSEGMDIAGQFGPLLGSTELQAHGGLPPHEFLALYQAASEPVQSAMRRQVTARLRELGRRGVFEATAVEAVLGPEGEGVPGSRFFGVAGISGDAYQALLDYLETAAGMVPGGTYKPSAAARARIDRSLQLYLALAGPEVREQYADFDVVWATVLRRLACAPPADQAGMLAGAGLGFLVFGAGGGVGLG